MKYINETLRNWLLGKSEIDSFCPSVPPDDSPEILLGKFSNTQNKSEMDKISKKLSKLGYEIKTVHVLKKRKE